MNSKRRQFLLGATAVAGAAALAGKARSQEEEAAIPAGRWSLGHRLADGRLVPATIGRRPPTELALGGGAEVRLSPFEGTGRLPSAVQSLRVEVDTGAGVAFTMAWFSREHGSNAPSRFIAPAGGFSLTVRTRWEGGRESVERFELDQLSRGGRVVAWLPEGEDRFDRFPYLAFDVEPLEATSRTFV